MAGRKALPPEEKTHVAAYTIRPKHERLLDKYRRRYELPNASAAVRHLIESTESAGNQK
jgi:hypothetical protein